MNKHDTDILTVTCYGHFLSHLNMLVFPAILLPLTQLLQLDLTDTLSLSFSMYLLFGVTSLPWGMLADRFGGRKLLYLFHGGAGVCALLAGWYINSPVWLAWMLAGIGFFSGIYHPAGLGWIAKAVSRTSVGMAYNGMFGNLGLATGPLLAGVVNYFFGPAAVYFMVGLLNLSGIYFLYRTPQGETDLQVKPKKTNSAASWPSFTVLLVAMMLGGIVYRGTTVTLPALFELRGAGIYNWLSGLLNGLDANVVATVLTSCLYLVGMVGQFVGGYAGERFDLRWGYFLFHAITIPVAFFVALLGDLPLVLMATVHSFFLLGMQPIENTLVARLTPPTLHHSAYGMKFVVSFGVGSLAVKLVEFVKSHGALSDVYTSLGFVSVLLVSVILLLVKVTPSLRS